MSILRLLHDADAIAHMALDGAIAIFSLVALYRTGLRFFGLIFAGMLLQVCLSLALQMHGYAFRPSDAPAFSTIYRVGVLVVIALFGPGFILLIRHVLR